MRTNPAEADLHEHLLEAVRAGRLADVREVIFHRAGTGLGPARLGLLEMRDGAGRTAEDLAADLAAGGPERREILDLLRAERNRMLHFE